MKPILRFLITLEGLSGRVVTREIQAKSGNAAVRLALRLEEIDSYTNQRYDVERCILDVCVRDGARWQHDQALSERARGLSQWEAKVWEGRKHDWWFEAQENNWSLPQRSSDDYDDCGEDAA